jgi:hypothetical protein
LEAKSQAQPGGLVDLLVIRPAYRVALGAEQFDDQPPARGVGVDHHSSGAKTVSQTVVCPNLDGNGS